MDTDRSLAVKMLIKSAPELKKSIPGLRIIAVGGGDDYENVKKLADKANDECGAGTVELTGARTDIGRIVSAADLFVGVSRAALEAMASGKNTLIAGNEGYIGIFSEDKLDTAIDTNFCCRGCRATDEKQKIKKILDFYRKPDAEKKKMSEFCRKVIIDNYSVSKMVDDCVRAYDSVL